MRNWPITYSNIPSVTVNRNRRAERQGVNAVRSLFEDHDLIVQEIDGSNDHGEDLFVTFTEGGERTGDTLAVQVKSGRSFRRKQGYRVPVDAHGEYWTRSNVPVICVVRDPDDGKLYWANASQQLREGRTSGHILKGIFVSRDSLLSSDSLPRFCGVMRRYIAETAELHHFLNRVSGATFDTRDYVAYFENEFGERIIFQQRPRESHARIFHADLDWVPEVVSPESLRLGGLAGIPEGFPLEVRKMFINVPTVGNVILDVSEAFWLSACFLASAPYRQ